MKDLFKSIGIAIGCITLFLIGVVGTMAVLNGNGIDRRDSYDSIRPVPRSPTASSRVTEDGLSEREERACARIATIDAMMAEEQGTHGPVYMKSYKTCVARIQGPGLRERMDADIGRRRDEQRRRYLQELHSMTGKGE